MPSRMFSAGLADACDTSGAASSAPGARCTAVIGLFGRLRPVRVDGAADQIAAEQEFRQLVEAPGQRNHAFGNALELPQVLAAKLLRLLERDRLERNLVADPRTAERRQIGG